MPLAGELAVAPYFTYALGTTSSASFTAETVVDTITANLIAGKTYEVTYNGLFQSSVAADVVNINLREDSISGTRMCDGRASMVTANKTFLMACRAIYVAVSTGSKTFVLTGTRDSGTGNITRAAASNDPSLMTVRRVI